MRIGNATSNRFMRPLSASQDLGQRSQRCVLTLLHIFEYILKAVAASIDYSETTGSPVLRHGPTSDSLVGGGVNVSEIFVVRDGVDMAVLPVLMHQPARVRVVHRDKAVMVTTSGQDTLRIGRPIDLLNQALLVVVFQLQLA